MRASPWALALTSAVVLGACSTQVPASAPVPSPTATLTAPASATPTPTPTPSPTPLRTSPLTGLPQPSPEPVLIVKLDNTHGAQPHAGLKQADVVYLEEVEYGITRIAAVFTGSVPARIGPVRSARITDIDLVSQFGTPALAFSGAQHKLWPALADASLIDVSPNKFAAGYERDPARRAPYNLFLDGPAALAKAKNASLDRDMGWVFSDEVPLGGMPAAKASMKWSWAKASFTYDQASGLYQVNLNGRRAEAEEDNLGQNAATVVIQYVHQEPSVYFDKGGGNTPQAQTIGGGKAVILRDGQAWDATWSRPNADGGTTFTLADGSLMAFKPGQQWIVLLNEKTPAKITAPPSSMSSSTSASPTGSPSSR